MKIDILISTYNAGIYNVESLLLDPDKDINYIVSHQITDSKIDISKCVFLHRPDVKYSQLNHKGLSKNRNNTFHLSEGDICFIADDDVSYNLSTIKKVAQKFKENPDLDIFVGKIKTYEGEPEYKKYFDREKVLGWRDIGRVSSIEMVVRRDSIIEKGIKFDTKFGLGSSQYPKGEEAIFLSDCLKKKLKIMFFPEYIVKHPKESSGSSVAYDERESEYMGALNYRIFKNMAFFSSIFFCFKHYARYRQYLSPFEYLLFFRKGIKKMKQAD